MQDIQYRFVLERAGVRGTLVRLGEVWNEVSSRADYPSVLQGLLGQALAASALLTGNIKFDGALSIELKSADALRLVFVECTDKGFLRGLARWSDPLPNPIKLSSLRNAHLAITVGRADRGQRYQGLVELSAPSLASVLENYFHQSEQLPTRILLASEQGRAVGLLLQKMPHEGGEGLGVVNDEDSWGRVGHLTATLSDSELLSVAPEQLLFRLYHEESVRIFEPCRLAFGCSCSRERVSTMLRSLGREEVEAALAARNGEIEVICEFCAQRYMYDRIDAEVLFNDKPSTEGSKTTQ